MEVIRHNIPLKNDLLKIENLVRLMFQLNENIIMIFFTHKLVSTLLACNQSKNHFIRFFLVVQFVGELF